MKKDSISVELQQNWVHFGGEVFPVRGYWVNPTWTRMELRSSLQPVHGFTVARPIQVRQRGENPLKLVEKLESIVASGSGTLQMYLKVTWWHNNNSNQYIISNILSDWLFLQHFAEVGSVRIPLSTVILILLFCFY